jgi:hypothetical protein
MGATCGARVHFVTASMDLPASERISDRACEEGEQLRLGHLMT